jgi:hypothetical protein
MSFVMHTNSLRALLLTVLLLTSCSGQASPPVLVTQQPTPKAKTLPSPTLRSTDIPMTPTQVPPSTLQSPQTQTPSAINVENLPHLSKVILTSSDIENLSDYDPSPMVLTSNESTNELQNSCLWDCAKYGYSLAWGNLTILLLRAGDSQKAKNTVESLRGDFLKTVSFEYTVNDLSSMPPDSWAMIDTASRMSDYRTSATGLAYGSIVILVTYSRDFCEDTTEIGRYCEGDLMQLVWDSVQVLNAQVQKLNTMGYPN